MPSRAVTVKAAFAPLPDDRPKPCDGGADKASGYVLEALRWAVENGVMSGKGGGILDPHGLATRAQTAQMLKNFLNIKQ